MRNDAPNSGKSMSHSVKKPVRTDAPIEDEAFKATLAEARKTEGRTGAGAAESDGAVGTPTLFAPTQAETADLARWLDARERLGADRRALEAAREAEAARAELAPVQKEVRKGSVLVRGREPKP